MAKDTLQAGLEFPYSAYYKKWKPVLLKMLKVSRMKKTRHSPTDSLAFQMALYKYIFDIEAVIEKQTLKHKMDKNDPNVVYHIRLVEILRAIGDGHAWRLMSFNRGLMRILSQNRSAGHLKILTEREKHVIIEQMLEYGHVLINDITNIIRIGDLTVIDSQGIPEVLEIKKKGDKILTTHDYLRRKERGGSLSRQAQRIVEFNQSIRKGSIDVGRNKALLMQLDFPINSYHNILDEAIEICKESGSHGQFADETLYIRALKIDKADKTGSYDLPFDISNGWLKFSNLDTFCIEYGEIYRNKVPYSVFPIDDDTVLQILSGELILDSYIHIDILSNNLQKNGWKVQRLPFKEINKLELMDKAYSGPTLLNFDTDNPILLISKDGFNMGIQTEHICLILCDYLKIDILNKIGNSIREITEKDRNSIAISAWYKGESDIWL